MRLLDTVTGQFVDKDPVKTEYAILSHTWDIEKGEQTYEELKKIQQRYTPRPHVPWNGPTASPRDSSTAVPSHLKQPRVSTSHFTRIRRESKLRLHCLPACSEFGFDTDTHACCAGPSALSPELPSKIFHPSIWDDRKLSPKIRDACAVARENGFRYIWIDSCCIDKSSSSELSEAINSMFRWYRLARVCYAYLADVPPGEDHRAKGSCFRKSRWFTRGWTLQELIAPANVVFLAKDWTPIGSKQALFDLVESITKIHDAALLKLKPLDTFSVAQRLSWAAKRETTREEDRAYSLLGIFDINMPTLYGEGDRAFRRLQEQIMQRIPDQSLFAWGTIHLPVPDFQGSRGPNPTEKITLRIVTWSHPQTPSAESPDDFANSRDICHAQFRLPGSHAHKIDYTFTPYGICTTLPMIPLTGDLLSQIFTPSEFELCVQGNSNSQWYVAILGCEHIQHPGHLLGRVFRVHPSESGVKLAYTEKIIVGSEARSSTGTLPDLFPLSPETIERCRPHIELKTVHISHPQSNHTDQNPLESLRRQPYAAIKLVLLKGTHDTLRSRGYSADLRAPDPDHPTTHWLTLSKAEHIIAVEFRHTLEEDGKHFTMDAEVKLSAGGSGVPRVDSAPDSHPALHSSCWTDRLFLTWLLGLGFQRFEFKFGDAGVGVLTVGLNLQFLGTGVYSVEVYVRSHALPPAPPDMPVVESAPPAPSTV